jgi:hypothetical protein
LLDWLPYTWYHRWWYLSKGPLSFWKLSGQINLQLFQTCIFTSLVSNIVSKTWVSLLKLLNARTHLKMTTSSCHLEMGSGICWSTTQLLINTWWIIIHSALWSQLMTIPITAWTCVCVWASWRYTARKVWHSLYLFIESNNNWSDHLEFWIIVCTHNHTSMPLRWLSRPHIDIQRWRVPSSPSFWSGSNFLTWIVFSHILNNCHHNQIVICE